MKIGSIVEEEEERGVAHIVEHLAFSATAVRFNRLYLTNFMFLSVSFLSGAPRGAQHSC